MSKWKTWQIVLFTILCLLLNIGGKLLSQALNLPLWLDSIGTVLSAYIVGPICGAMVGVTGNLLSCSITRQMASAAYSLTSISLSIIVWVAAKNSWFDGQYGFMKAASLAMIVALVVSVPLNIVFNQGYTGNAWGNVVVDYLMIKHWPFFICSVMGQLSIEFPDKLLTVGSVYLVIMGRRLLLNRTGEPEMGT